MDNLKWLCWILIMCFRTELCFNYIHPQTSLSWENVSVLNFQRSKWELGVLHSNYYEGPKILDYTLWDLIYLSYVYKSLLFFIFKRCQTLQRVYQSTQIKDRQACLSGWISPYLSLVKNVQLRFSEWRNHESQRKDSAQIYFKSVTELSPALMDFKWRRRQKLNLHGFLDFSSFRKKTGNPRYISNTLLLHSSVTGALGESAARAPAPVQLL